VWQTVTVSSSYLDWFLLSTLSQPLTVAKDDSASIITKYASVCVCMNVFKCNNLLSESWLGSILIKCLGHPMNGAKGLSDAILPPKGIG